MTDLKADLRTAAERVLAAFSDVKQTKPDEWIALCPAHDDHKHSLSIRIGDKAVLVHCFAGCLLSAVLNAKGLVHADLCPPKLQTAPRGSRKIVATYDYRNELEEVVFQVVRYEPKDFRQRRPDGQGNWIWKMKGVHRVLYRLPEVRAAVQNDQTIFLVEGEKDADNLADLGLVATTSVGGVTKWSSVYNTMLAGADVVLIPDNDEPGRKHVERVATSLTGYARSIKVLELPGLPTKGDVSDWLKAGGDAGELHRLVESTPPWTKQAPPPTPPAAPVDAGQQVPSKPESENQFTDVGNGLRLVQRHGQDLRYVYAQGRWYVWDGRRWKRDNGDAIEKKAKETARALFLAASDAGDLDERKCLASHALKMESYPRMQAMIAMARSEVPATNDDFDQNHWLLNAANGTVDLRTGCLHPHKRDDFITKIAAPDYLPDAEAPHWDAFLAQVLPDPDVRSFMQRAVGYALTGDVSEQCLFFLHGSGSNGKSTFLRALMDALGEYAIQAAPDLLIAKEYSGGPNNDVADLQGTRFVATIEVEDGKRMAEGLVKQITGGDRIKARFMRQDFFEFEPTHKIFLAANHQPTIRGQDFAIWRRIKVIPFTVQIADEDKDTTLPDKLRKELAGILAWAVRGCLEWQRIGLSVPEPVKSATEDYRGEMDVLRDFLSECCVLGPREEVTTGALYVCYEKWCVENGDRPLGKRTFGSRLKEQEGIRSAAGVGPRLSRGWIGIGLKARASVDSDISDKTDPVSPMNSLSSSSHEDMGESTSEMSEMSEDWKNGLVDPFAEEDSDLSL